MQFAIILTTSLSILLTHAIPMPNPDTKAASLLARANVADTGPDTSSIYRTGSTGSTTDIQDPDHITPGSSLQQAQAGSTPEEKEKTTYKNGKPFVGGLDRPQLIEVVVIMRSAPSETWKALDG
ncbi:uncharacterized protein KY384_000144 [Bacidia gigantensis]|uniref:uncharacterized protein n=1 Tax=Bacidia gigantensis TaxID=2732470 RepID=UPI001D047DAC|nr:uncharacterized protein KY384_000144 [Bacidia gigantensis]KAG8526151.1 hypothetical protein KY384_000144 [Bacidia gigantensis]